MLFLVLGFLAGIGLGGGSVYAYTYFQVERDRIYDEVEAQTATPLFETDSGIDTGAEDGSDGEGDEGGDDQNTGSSTMKGINQCADVDVLELDPVNVQSSVWGLVQAWRRRAKERRLAEKGYIKWLQVDSQLQAPKYVKPKRRGAGVGELHTDDGPYYFPKDSMVTDARTGAWVAVHEVGDADPINLRETAYPGLPVDRVEELLNMTAEAEKPGFLENLDISPKAAFILITVVLFIVYAATRVM